MRVPLLKKTSLCLLPTRHVRGLAFSGMDTLPFAKRWGDHLIPNNVALLAEKLCLACFCPMGTLTKPLTNVESNAFCCELEFLHCAREIGNMAVQQMRPPGGADDGRAHSHASYRSRVRTGASLSALYLTRPQRLVGCSLPPQAKSPTNGGHATKGFVTLAVPHILESAATTQTLPATSLVRFRWRREESQRGSLFQPARITNDRGLHAPRDHSDEDTETGGEDEAKQGAQRGNAAARSIEMVYPICVDAERFVEYLCEMVACADGVLKWSISTSIDGVVLCDVSWCRKSSCST